MNVLDLSNDELRILLDHIDSVDYGFKLDIYKNISEILNRIYMNGSLIYTKDSPLFNILKRIKTSINPRYTSLNIKPLVIDEDRYRESTLSTDYCRIINRIQKYAGMSRNDSMYLYKILNTPITTEYDIIKIIKSIDSFVNQEEPESEVIKVIMKYIIPHKLEYLKFISSLNENKNKLSSNYIYELWKIEPYDSICNSFMKADVYTTYIAIAALLYKYVYRYDNYKPDINILMYLIKVSQPNIFKASMETFKEYLQKDEIDLLTKIKVIDKDNIQDILTSKNDNDVYVFGVEDTIGGDKLIDKILQSDYSALKDMIGKNNLSRDLTKNELCYLRHIYKDNKLGVIRWYDSVYCKYNTQYLLVVDDCMYLLFRDKSVVDNNKLYGVSLNDTNNLLIIDINTDDNYEIISDFNNIDNLD